jgi:hypothetical protein
MTDMIRRSPVVFPQEAIKKETIDHWTVVMEYKSEGQGPWIVDLSHRPRWDLQDSDLAGFNPFGIDIPESPGECCFQNNVLANRMNRTQVSLWQLTGDRLEASDDTNYTDTVDATLFLAILGKDVFAIAEKLSALDFGDPAISTPRLFQGPFAHVPCQIVLMGQADNIPGILLTCSRGYARDMVAAVLHAGKEFNLQPAGQAAFKRWLDGLA